MKRVIVSLAALALVSVASAGDIIPVREWPKKICAEYGVVHNPSINSLVAAGYRLIGPTPETPEGKRRVSMTYEQDPYDPTLAAVVCVYEDIPVVAPPEKPDKLKRAENRFIESIMAANTRHGLDISTSDGYDEAFDKISNSGIERIDKLEIGMELQTRWAEVLYQGGAWTNLEYHVDVAND